MEVQPERDSNYIQASDGHLIIIQVCSTNKDFKNGVQPSQTKNELMHLRFNN